MADTTISSTGRFSSQMLTYLGTQRTVNEQSTNTYTYSSGPTFFPTYDPISQSSSSPSVLGSVDPNTYYAVRAFFMSRGATIVYAETMALVVIDIAKINNISPFTLIEKIESNSQIRFADDAYSAFNILRDPSHQVGTISDINNNNSFRSKEIRA